MAARKSAEKPAAAAPPPEPDAEARAERARLRPPAGGARWPPAARAAPPTVPIEAVIDAEFSATQLRELARQLGFALHGTSKMGFVEQTTAHLRERLERARRNPELLLDGLTAEQALFVRRALTARDPAVPLPRGLAGALTGRGQGPDADRRLTEMLEGLRRRAMLFPSRFTHYGTYRDVFYQWPPMADDALTPVVEWRAAMVRPPPGEIRPGATFLSDLDQTLAAIYAEPVPLRPPSPAHAEARRLPWLRGWEHDADEADRLLRSRSGWAPDPRSGIRVAADDVASPAGAARLQAQTGLLPRHCQFLLAVAAGMNLITAPEPGQTTTTIRADAYETWLTMPAEDRLAEAWACWTHQLALGVEASLAGVSAYRVIGAADLDPAHIGAEWCGLRRYVARVLRGLPAGAWIDWEKLRRALWEFHPFCANALLSRDVFWLAAAPGQRPDPARWPDWVATAGAVLESAISGPLAWFGAVDVVEEGGSLSAFRVTETGAWLIGGLRDVGAPLPAAARPAARVSEPVTWLSDTEWRMPPAPERGAFLAFARQISEPAGAPFTYRVTAASLEAALAQGLGPEQAAERFAAMGAPMPAPTAARFRGIAERFGRVRAYASVAVLTLGDDLALRELMAATSLPDAVIYILSPRAVVVRADAIDDLVRELTEKGFTPGVRP